MFMRTQLTEIKWLLMILDLKRNKAVKKCCFLGMQQTNRYYSVKPIVKQRCHVDL